MYFDRSNQSNGMKIKSKQKNHSFVQQWTISVTFMNKDKEIVERHQTRCTCTFHRKASSFNSLHHQRNEWPNRIDFYWILSLWLQLRLPMLKVCNDGIIGHWNKQINAAVESYTIRNSMYTRDVPFFILSFNWKNNRPSDCCFCGTIHWLW